eukprot:TRINITY_DN22519_c1_g1_i1.p1 TRINITY_DN22519_c1_g1~~TRINITY_DN22519_c1_g1_i1.p1  ORF type:complete len:602 (+),score=128.29 TRINITY_DN22519_c1_g1_i1:91-1806(+)
MFSGLPPDARGRAPSAGWRARLLWQADGATYWGGWAGPQHAAAQRSCSRDGAPAAAQPRAARQLPPAWRPFKAPQQQDCEPAVPQQRLRPLRRTGSAPPRRPQQQPHQQDGGAGPPDPFEALLRRAADIPSGAPPGKDGGAQRSGAPGLRPFQGAQCLRRFWEPPAAADAELPEPPRQPAPGPERWSSARPATAGAAGLAARRQKPAWGLPQRCPSASRRSSPVQRPASSGLRQPERRCGSANPARRQAPAPQPPVSPAARPAPTRMPPAEVLGAIAAFLPSGQPLLAAALASREWYAGVLSNARQTGGPPRARAQCEMCGARRCQESSDDYCPSCEAAFVFNAALSSLAALPGTAQLLQALGPPDAVSQAEWDYCRLGLSFQLDAVALPRPNVDDGQAPPSRDEGALACRPAPGRPLRAHAVRRLARTHPGLAMERSRGIAAITFHAGQGRFMRYPLPLPDGIALGGPAWQTVGQHLWTDYSSAATADSDAARLTTPGRTHVFSFDYCDSAAGGGIPQRCLRAATLHLSTIPLTPEEREDLWGHADAVREKLRAAGYLRQAAPAALRSPL